MKKPANIYAKQDAIRSALDELPELLERINKEKPVSPSILNLRNALKLYPFGLPSNCVRLQKPLIHFVDSGISLVLYMIEEYQRYEFDIDKFKVVYDVLELINGKICEVIKIEETRPRSD